MRAVITLTTDFGVRDWFVGVMKGVIARIAPEASVIDITNEIEPFNIEAAAFVLHSSYSYFPAGTVHVCVVDPQVGSKRRPLLIEYEDFYFIGPDNGVFSFVINENTRAYVIDEKRCGLPISYGRTFDGRDIFAAAAASIIKGATLTDIAAPIDFRQLTVIENPRPKAGNGVISGRIIYVDRFGNLITNIHLDQLTALSGGKPDNEKLKIEVEKGPRLRLCDNYESIPAIGCLINSSGHLEIAANKGNARDILGLTKFSGERRVTVSFS